MAVNTFIPNGYRFTITSASATVGATYTNNGQTFTVLATIAASTTLICSGTGAPSASGTLTKASGTGSTPITFSAVVTNIRADATQNWSLGVVPTLTDTNTATFDAASPNCDATATNFICNILDCTNYTGTLTHSGRVLQVGGNITLGAAMTLTNTTTNTYLLAYTTGGAAQSIKSNGCYVPYLYISGINPHTTTLLDNFNVGIFQHLLTTNVVQTLNGFKILVNDNYILATGNRTMVGTTVIEFTGGAACSWGGTVNTSLVSNPIIINKSGGTLMLDAYLGLGAGAIVTHTSGTVDATTNNNTLSINGVSTTLNTSGMTWNIILIIGLNTGLATLTLNSTMNAKKIHILYWPFSFIGTSPFICDTFVYSASLYGVQHLLKLKENLTYVINTNFEGYSSQLGTMIFQSNLAGTKAILNYNGTNANQVLVNVDFTDIDASGGNKLWSLNGVITNSDNIGVSTSSIVPVTVTKTF